MRSYREAPKGVSNIRRLVVGMLKLTDFPSPSLFAMWFQARAAEECVQGARRVWTARPGDLSSYMSAVLPTDDRINL